MSEEDELLTAIRNKKPAMVERLVQVDKKPIEPHHLIASRRALESIEDSLSSNFGPEKRTNDFLLANANEEVKAQALKEYSKEEAKPTPAPAQTAYSKVHTKPEEFITPKESVKIFGKIAIARRRNEAPQEELDELMKIIKTSKPEKLDNFERFMQKQQDYEIPLAKSIKTKHLHAAHEEAKKAPKKKPADGKPVPTDQQIMLDRLKKEASPEVLDQFISEQLTGAVQQAPSQRSLIISR